MQIINPATEEIIFEIKEDTKDTLASKFESLQKTQPSWQQTSLAERVQVLTIFSDLLEKKYRTACCYAYFRSGKTVTAIAKRGQWSKNEN